MGVPQMNTRSLERPPDGAMVLAEVVAEALASPALGIEGGGFLDLVGRQAAGSADPCVRENLGDRGSMEAEGLGELVGLLACLVASDQLGPLIGSEAVVGLLSRPVPLARTVYPWQV